MTATALVNSKKMVRIEIPINMMELLISCEDMWDGQDEYRKEKYGKDPHMCKLVRKVIVQKLKVRGKIRENNK